MGAALEDSLAQTAPLEDSLRSPCGGFALDAGVLASSAVPQLPAAGEVVFLSVGLCQRAVRPVSRC